MTCRRPTISVRLAVLERLAKANAVDETPDSKDFAPVSWSELDRTSFTDGLADLLAYQEARVAAEDQKKAEEVRKLALKRALQREQARKWEQELSEKNRARDLERRIEEARLRAAEDATDVLASRRAALDVKLKTQTTEQAWEREIATAEVVRIKRRWGLAVQSTLAAAALGAVVWVSAFGQARSATAEEFAEMREGALDEEMAALTRVAELEAEIDRRVHMTASERMTLEKQLTMARSELASAEKDREEIDRRRRPSPTPGRLAKTIQPVKDVPAVVDSDQRTSPPQSSSLKVAAEDVVGEGCVAYDPMCFEL